GASASHPGLVDVAALLESHAPAWHALTAAHGAEFRLEPPLIVTQADAPVTAGAGAVAASPLAPLPPIIAPARACPLTLLRGGRALLPPSFPGDVSPTTVVGDPLRLAQACANLVANAAEHGGGVVRVRVRVAG